MASCFPTTGPELSSSDRTIRSGAKALFGNIKDNIRRNIPQKIANKPGSVNYRLCGGPGGTGTITGAMSHRTRLDMMKGQFLCDKPCFLPGEGYYYGMFGANSRFKQQPHMRLIETWGVQRAPTSGPSTRPSPPNWQVDGKANAFLSVSQDFWTGADSKRSCWEGANLVSELVTFPAPGRPFRDPCGTPRQAGADPAISIANPKDSKGNQSKPS